MDALLNAVECRVLACLIEKEITTPEYYPLSLHALQAACNQKSNRDPVVEFDEKTIARALEDLRSRHLAWEVAAAGGRTPKYKHDFLSRFAVGPDDLSVLCELMLRGPQTAGELRARAGRMHAFADVAAVDRTLQALAERPDGALVARLPLSPGMREVRYAHLLCGEAAAPAVDPSVPPAPAMAAVRAENERIAALEQSVAELRAEMDVLKQKLASLLE